MVRSAITNYAKRGMPRDTSTRPHGYDPDECKAWIRANIRKKGGDQYGLPDEIEEEPDLDSAQAQELYRRERALKTKAERELRDLKLAEERGELVRADEVEKTWSAALVRLRGRLLRLPAELAAPAFGCATELEVEEHLRAGVRAALEELADG